MMNASLGRVSERAVTTLANPQSRHSSIDSTDESHCRKYTLVPAGWCGTSVSRWLRMIFLLSIR